MPVFQTRLIREAGPEPITGECIPEASEVVAIEAESLWRAKNRLML